MTNQKYICSVCGSEKYSSKISATDKRYRTTDRVFDVIECENCHVAQTVPQPSEAEMGSFYPEIYYPTEPSTESYYTTFVELPQMDKVRIIQRYRKDGKLLDVGCGVGHFVVTANRNGYEAEGLEYSETAANSGRTRWNLTITTGDFLSAQIPPASFDIITLWQVFEHLRQPREVLQKINTLLRPGGLLVIAVPNIGSVQAKIFKSNWYHLDVPRHLFHYSPNSLSPLVASCGFEVKQIDFNSPEHNYAGYLGSVMRLSPPGESFIHKLVRKTVGIYTARAFAAAEKVAGTGGIFTIAAVKK